MMSGWEGIKDASPELQYIWLSRETDSDLWTPLRKSDCRVLNENMKRSKCEEVYVDFGRSTANVVTMKLCSNYNQYPERQLCRSGWFVVKKKKSSASNATTSSPVGDTSGCGTALRKAIDRDITSTEYDGKNLTLEPIFSTEDTLKLEDLYHRAVRATSSLGEGIAEIRKEEVLLHEGETHVAFLHSLPSSSSQILSLKRKPYVPSQKILSAMFSSLGGTTVDMLQRGYGEYRVEGEDVEITLGPVKHLVFVVHGIGEAMWSSSGNDIPSLQETIGTFRRVTQRKQVEAWKKRCAEVEGGKSTSLPPPPNRIELIPIEWYDQIHSSSSIHNHLMSSLERTTLKSIPTIRSVANDVLFDVLMYMTPTFCRAVIEHVTESINKYYHLFHKIHPHFDEDPSCAVSIIGHSLGSVISWDLLSILKSQTEPSHMASGAHPKTTTTSIPPTLPFERGTWMPPCPESVADCLHFKPNLMFFIGSPLGCLLTLRGAHHSFDALRTSVADGDGDVSTTTSKETAKSAKDTMAIVSPFTLPVQTAVFNIFHPSDPVAYRIEPLLLPLGNCNSDVEIPPPVILATDQKGLRLHVKAKMIQEGVSKNLKIMEQVLKQTTANASILLKQGTGETSGTHFSSSSSFQLPYAETEYCFPLGGGPSNRRVDYELQTSLVNNEYLSAITAHTSYWINEDFIDFFLEKAAVK